jgi:hypothetical protein
MILISVYLDTTFHQDVTAYYFPWLISLGDQDELLTIIVLGIIHRSVCCLGHDVSGTGYYLRLHAELAQLGPIVRHTFCVQSQLAARIIQSNLYQSFDMYHFPEPSFSFCGPISHPALSLSYRVCHFPVHIVLFQDPQRKINGGFTLSRSSVSSCAGRTCQHH